MWVPAASGIDPANQASFSKKATALIGSPTRSAGSHSYPNRIPRSNHVRVSSMAISLGCCRD